MSNTRSYTVTNPLLLVSPNPDGTRSVAIHADGTTTVPNFGALLADLVEVAAQTFSVDREVMWAAVDERRHSVSDRAVIETIVNTIKPTTIQ